MTQINISDKKLAKVRVKMSSDPMYRDRNLRFDSDLMNGLCDTYLQKDRDKELIRSTVKATLLELVAEGKLKEVPG